MILFVCENENTLTQPASELPEECKDPNSFDPASTQPIEVIVDDKTVIMPFCDWLKLLGTNGRGGT